MVHWVRYVFFLFVCLLKDNLKLDGDKYQV